MARYLGGADAGAGTGNGDLCFPAQHRGERQTAPPQTYLAAKISFGGEVGQQQIKTGPQPFDLANVFRIPSQAAALGPVRPSGDN
jgi:hypothetical protein